MRRLGALLAAGAALLLVAAVLLVAAGGGVGLGSVTRGIVAIAVLQLLPGVLVWRAVRPEHGWWVEDVVAGLTLGIPVAVASQVVAGLSRLPVLATVLPLLLSGALLAVPAVRRRVLSRRTASLPWWWVPLSGVPALVTVEGLRAYGRSVPLSWPSGSRAPYVDTYAHLAWASEIARRGPERFPWVRSEVLGYHWFSHAWVAHVSVVSHVPLDAVLLRLMPAAVPLFVALAASVAALRITGQAWTGPLAALLCLAGGRLTVGTVSDQAFPVSAFSPSLGLGAPTLLLLVVVLALRWRGELGRASLPLVLVLALTTAGTKASTLPLVLAGLVLAVAVFAVQDRQRVRALVLETVVLGAALELAVQFVYHGSGGGLALDPRAALAVTEGASEVGGTATAGAVAVIVVLVVVADLARAAGLGLALLSPTGRQDPLPWVLLGAGLSATGAVLLLAQEGHSQAYFVLSSEPLLALASTVGLASALRRTGTVVRAVLVGAVGGVALRLQSLALYGTRPPHDLGTALVLLFVGIGVLVLVVLASALILRVGKAGVVLAAVTAVLVAGVTGVAVQQVRIGTAPLAGPANRAVAPTARLAVSRGQIAAARWIRDHSGVDDLVMTNRHCVGVGSPVGGCDSRRFVVAAFSERQVLVEGWTYTPRSVAISSARSIVVPYWDPGLLALNDGFIARPSAAAEHRLHDLGVRWVYADHTRPHAITLAPYADLRFRDAAVDVYELRP